MEQGPDGAVAPVAEAQGDSAQLLEPETHAQDEDRSSGDHLSEEVEEVERERIGVVDEQSADHTGFLTQR